MRRYLIWLLAVLSGLPFLAVAAQPEGPVREPHVLILSQEQGYLPASQMLTRGISEELSAGYPGALIYLEYLDLSRIRDQGLQREQLDWLDRKYEGIRFDVIVALGPDVLAAVREHPSSLVQDSPVVFFVPGPLVGRARANEIGVQSVLGTSQTLGLIRRLLPETSRVVVIRGSSRVDALTPESVFAPTDSSAPGVEILTGEPLSDLERRVSAYPRGTVLLLTSMNSDRNGRMYSTQNVAKSLAAHGSVPLFVTLNTTMGTGAVGGALLDYSDAGRILGKSARAVLDGTSGALGGTIAQVEPTLAADVSAMRRFGIPESRLPPLANRVNEQNLSPRYMRLLAFGLVFLLLQGATILALLLSRRRRRRAESALSARAQFERIIADASHALTSVGDTSVPGAVAAWLERIAGAMAANGAALLHIDEETGTPQTRAFWFAPEVEDIQVAELTGNQLQEFMAGETLVRKVPAFVAGYQDQELFVPATAGGRTGDALYVRLPRIAELELPIARLRILGELLANALVRARNAVELRERVADLEESRREQRRLAGHLIGAQENERRRVARELHDDITQRLSLLGLQLSTATPGSDQATLEVAAERVSHLAADVSRLSHQLHPDLLHRIGLAAALRGLCRDFTEPGGLAVECQTEPLATEPTTAVALAAYRVAQEALRNIRKHSDASQATVLLTEAGDCVELEVSDTGKGFDAGDTGNYGLGLISMRERAEMLGGGLTIESAPGKGTILRLRLPVSAHL